MIQLISDAYQSTDDDLVSREIELLGRIAAEVGRPLSFTVQQIDDAPDRFRELLAAIDGWNNAGADVEAQVAVRPIGVLIGLQATVNPFMFCPSYQSLRPLDHEERMIRLRDPGLRRRLLDEHATSSPSGFVGILHSGCHRMYPLSDPPDYEPTPADDIAAPTTAVGETPDQFLSDLLLDDGRSRLLYIPS